MKKFIAYTVLMTTLCSAHPAWGDARVVAPGETITEPGVFFPAKDAIEAAEMLDRYKGLVDRVAAMEKQIADQSDQIDVMLKSMGSSEREIVLKDLIIKHKDEMLTFRKEINDEYKALIAEGRNTMTKDRETITRLEKRIEALEKKSIWGTLLGIAIGIAAGIFTGGLLH